MKTKYYFLAALATAVFASCTSDEYVGDVNSPVLTSQGTTGAIAFGSNAGNLTRATSNTGTVAEMLDHHFKFYGVKDVSGYTDVFQNYAAWDATTKTTSNPDGAEVDASPNSAMNGWEYVGNGSTYGGLATQTIKYWDYSASNYHFVAGSPYSSFTFNLTSGDITTATVTGLAGHISKNNVGGGGSAITTDPVYIADPVKVEPTNYQKEVVFSFKRQQSFVRVGVFETIPGYSISSISFYPYEEASDAWGSIPSNNITLVSKTAEYFRGSAAGGTATVTYDWSPATPTYTFAYTDATLTKSKNWYAGQLMSGVPAKTSTEAIVANLYGTDLDMAAATGYFTVIPSPSALAAQPILIKCDYTLKADDDKGETINVKSATAAIPAAFSKWNPNTTYTYLFKISDNTNGTTGTPGVNPEGLYPITFDAAVIAETDAMKQGYITTVSTPSITTYQAGSVTANGVEYVVGTPIYFTAQNDETGALNTLSAGNYDVPALGGVHVFKLDGPATEADLILTRPAKAKIFTHTVGSAAWNINGQTVAAGNWDTFTPDEAGTYAIEYCTQASPAAFAYKIVTVVASH